MSNDLLKLGILVSGRGSNLGSILDACEKKTIQAMVSVVISNKPEALALARAKKAGVSTEVVLAKKGESKEEFEKKIIHSLKQHGVNWVILAGFMRVLSPYFVSHYKHHILNIHPSLLPSFPGLDAQKQALEYGVRYSGCTVHLVDEGCDTGPIVLQTVVPVLPTDSVDTLSERILEQEHRLLPKAIDLFAKNKVIVTSEPGQKTKVILKDPL